MKGFVHFQQALVNIRAAKMRSFLALLGILVGTSAVVALLSSGQLATEKALAQFKSLGTNLLAVTVFQKNSSTNATLQDSISIDEWRQLPERVPEIAKIAPYSTSYQSFNFLGKSLSGPVIGADEALADIIQIHMAAGHFVSFVDSFEHFCVLGDGVAQKLKEESLDDPIGKQLKIGHSLYTIIGVVQPWSENGFFNEDINQAVIVPISGMMLINKDTKVNNAIMRLKSDERIDDLIAQIKSTLLQKAPKMSVFVRSAKQIITSMENQGRIFTMLLAVIGSISLLVGGIGVMNVMLVSVSERKKEIGIRKAVGAKNSEIQTLFLVESVLLSLLGGFLGVILGVLLTWVIAFFNQWPFKLHAFPLIAGFAVSAVTGVFFGFYPARRASFLEPIASLRAN